MARMDTRAVCANKGRKRRRRTDRRQVFPLRVTAFIRKKKKKKEKEKKKKKEKEDSRMCGVHPGGIFT